MTKNKISKYILFVSIFSFLAAFAYIVSVSYDKLMQPINTAQGSNLIKPINPELDTGTLDLIEARLQYTSP